MKIDQVKCGIISDISTKTKGNLPRDLRRVREHANTHIQRDGLRVLRWDGGHETYMSILDA